ncbi:hypothetical protein AC64_1110 [Escherichia coli 6-537-08_S3_C3]|nr:hypothetical protein AC64_1110 [Escherichia coli 6-537-08_S3_C3]
MRKCCNVIFRNRMIVMAGVQINCFTLQTNNLTEKIKKNQQALAL